MNLKFKRRICKSSKNRSAVITIPRSIAQLWEQYETLDVCFDGESLLIKPNGVEAG